MGQHYYELGKFNRRAHVRRSAKNTGLKLQNGRGFTQRQMFAAATIQLWRRPTVRPRIVRLRSKPDYRLDKEPLSVQSGNNSYTILTPTVAISDQSQSSSLCLSVLPTQKDFSENKAEGRAV